MHRFFLVALSFVFAVQPVMASASSITVPPHSPRIIRQAYEAQQQKRLSMHGTQTQTYAKVGDYAPALPAGGLAIGSSAAPVTIVEFVDYACPSCAQFETQTMPMLKSQYIDTGKIRFVVRNFPLSYHAAATVAAAAVECVRDQNESYGWTLHDMLLGLMQKNGDLTQDDVYHAFQSIKGIDTETMYYCLDTNAKQALINRDMSDAVNGGINGTPSFWVLGQHGKAELIQGAVSFATFQKVIAAMSK